MTPPAPGSLSPTAAPPAAPDTALLEDLAAAGEALTNAIVHHDLDAIVAATKRAEDLVNRLSAHDAERTPGRRRRGAASEVGIVANADPVDHDSGHDETIDPDVLALGARIGATARRNAMLLEHAWATDAALLRLLATAARTEAQQSIGVGYAPPSQAPVPAGWLDRSA